MVDQSSRAWTFREAVQPGIEAVKKHWPALIVIQAAALALVLSYYHFDSLRQAAEVIGQLKVRFGVLFAFVAGTLAGGAVPEFAKFLTGAQRRLDRDWFLESAFNAFVYGVVAVQVDLFYRGQTYAFGPQHTFPTLCVKTAVDMAVFSPTISIPTATILLVLRQRGFRLRNVFDRGWRDFYKHQVMPGLIPCWFFWTPVLFCTYAMPANLQLCFANLLEAAWSILFVTIAKSSTPITTAP